nr:probable protein ABIL5 isoform X1 [Ipomoea trifida]
MQVDSVLPANEQMMKMIPEVEETDEDNDDAKFQKSLRELRDLCSQLHHAADYCETTFQNSEQKRSVVEHTREYICRAVVTVVDHLGCVSANLECCLAKSNNISETELRIDCLKQRLGTSQYYAQKLAVTRFYWSASCPRFHPRYLSPPMPDPMRTGGVTRESDSPVATKPEFEAEDEVPLFLYTCNYKASLAEDTENGISSSPVLPVRHDLPALPKPQNPNFEFQDGRKLKRSILNWKALQTTDLKSMIRRGKRTLNTPVSYC